MSCLARYFKYRVFAKHLNTAFQTISLGEIVGKYVSRHQKYYTILCYLCANGPANLSTLAEVLVRNLGMRFSTARSAVTRIYEDLKSEKVGLVVDVGVDKKGGKLVDLSPKAVYLIMHMLVIYGKKAIGFDPQLLLPVLKRYLAEDAVRKYEDLVAIMSIYEKYREKYGRKKPVKEPDYKRFMRELIETLSMERDLGLPGKYGWEDISSTVDSCIEVLLREISSLDFGKLRTGEYYKVLTAILNEILSSIKFKGTREVVKKALTKILREKKREREIIKEIIDAISTAKKKL